MVKSIPAIVLPELMKPLIEMGHGDEKLICDGNYPKAGSPVTASQWMDMAFPKCWKLHCSCSHLHKPVIGPIYSEIGMNAVYRKQKYSEY